jgi:hypothetical protein
MRVDIHQHLWSEEFVAALRARAAPPLLDGWRLRLAGEPDFVVDPRDHDPARRAAELAADGTDRALVSLSSPLGVEHLPPAEARPLLDAYHAGAARLPAPFGAWAAACVTDPDPDALAAVLDAGFVGLQLPATALADAAGYARCAPLLTVLAARRKPLLVHPGPATVAAPGGAAKGAAARAAASDAMAGGAAPGDAAPGGAAPGWWAAMVPYVTQMHAAWFAYRTHGRHANAGLRVCFCMLAGLAPLHHERAAARGAPDGAGDSDVWVETSSYGPEAIAAVARVLGAGAIVRGSDRPYAAPSAWNPDERAAPRLLGWTPAATHA